MNSKVAKMLRQFAKYRMLPHKFVKKVWENSSKEERQKYIAEIKQTIELGIEAEKKAQERKKLIAK